VDFLAFKISTVYYMVLEDAYQYVTILNSRKKCVTLIKPKKK